MSRREHRLSHGEHYISENRMTLVGASSALSAPSGLKAGAFQSLMSSWAFFVLLGSSMRGAKGRTPG